MTDFPDLKDPEILRFTSRMGNQGFRQGSLKDTYFSIGEAEFAVAKGLEE